MRDSLEPTRERIRPFVALRSLRALLRDPDDTQRVFEVVYALSGRTGPRLLKRFRGTPTGARLLCERPDLRAALGDLERLRSLPVGSLGRSYADFTAREQISPDGLLEASAAAREEGSRSRPEEARWFDERIRVMHDLWHVATGYDRDLVGEAGLLAFTFAQTRNPGIAFILVGSYAKAGVLPDARRTIRDGWRRGRRAAWLPAQDWEALLERPLDEIRRELGLGAPPVYQPFRSAGARAIVS